MRILDPLKYVKWSCLQQNLTTEKMLTNILKDAITDIYGFLNVPLKPIVPNFITKVAAEIILKNGNFCSL